MRVTRSSSTSIASSVKKRPKTSERRTTRYSTSAANAAKPKPSPQNKRAEKAPRDTKKRKCRSLPASIATPLDQDDDEPDVDDIQSVHSDEDLEINFNFNCTKCKKKFERRSYLVMHFRFAHNIDLGPIEKVLENGFTKRPLAKDQKEKDDGPPSKRAKMSNKEFLKVEDEDYFSCDSLNLDGDRASEDWIDDSDLDVESVFDEFLQCSHCDLVFEHQLMLDTHTCLMRNLSPEHRDIVKNQPFVELSRIRGSQSKKQNRRKLQFLHVCPICSVRFVNKVDMVIHAQNEHRVDPNLMKFASNNGMDPSNSKNGTYQRESVRKSKGKKSDLNDGAAEKLSCSVCAKSFSTKNKLDAHTEKEHHEKGPKKFDHNTDPLAKALTKRLRLGRGDPKNRVCSLMNMLGLTLQTDPAKYV